MKSNLHGWAGFTGLFSFAPGESLEFQFRIAEVDEQSHPDASGIQVVDDLRFMLQSEGLNSFEFHDDSIINQNVSVEVANGLPR